MSGDEVFALIVGGLLSLVTFALWAPHVIVRRFRRFTGWLLTFVPPLLAAAIMFYILRRWSSHDVRDDYRYIAFYMVLWAGWMSLMNILLPHLGLICRDDVLERGNTAAGLATSGAIVGATLTFAGGNIGNGPGWWVVIFCAALATGTLLLLWIALNAINPIEEAITVDRDLASGWRMLGFFIGAGLILGRAVAGDWTTAGGTIADFIRQGWAVLILVVVSAAVDYCSRPTPQKPAPNVFLHGLIPCGMYLATGIAVVLWQGTWE